MGGSLLQGRIVSEVEFLVLFMYLPMEGEGEIGWLKGGNKGNMVFSSIVGTKQIPLWVHLNFPPLHETSSQGPKPNHAHIARTVWL